MESGQLETAGIFFWMTVTLPLEGQAKACLHLCEGSYVVRNAHDEEHEVVG